MDLTRAYPPHVLREYALLADGERGALVGPRGDISWMCAPRWDSPAVFSELVGGEGVFAVSPDVDRYVWGGHYEPRSLIWRSRWVTTDGIVESRDALAFPGDEGRAVILRRVRAVDCAAPVKVTVAPSGDFGTKSLRDTHRARGVWTARTGRLNVRLTGVEGARSRDGLLVLTLQMEPGDVHDLVLEISDAELPDELPDAEALWKSTEASWQQAIPDLGSTLTPRDASHAYAVLRGLTSRGGGMVAAATMSLPERAETGRNYDYRYAWIRDQCYAGQAAAVTTAAPLLDGAVGFISSRLLADGPNLKPAYTVDGGAVPDEQTLRQLAGYPGGTDKTGNWVNQQFQLDAFGECLLLFAAAARHDHLDTDHWKAVEIAADAIARRWTEPDAGIWEIDNEHWTHSRLTCAAGLRSIATYATGRQAADFEGLADTIVAQTARVATHSTGRWQRSVKDGSVDAALLLPSIRGAVPADDARTLATLQAVRDELVEEHFVYRFRQQPGWLGASEGAFVLCGFIMALAEHQQGRPVSAARYFERNRGACGPPGLFSEEFDVKQRQLRGNIPQAFVHALLLETASTLREGDV
ncbi:MAG TPA: glycoside hydrolase family 15 protein [Mycobacteriales bacterium]|jgi:GH15 family glucan-1,4-alpha-glucosidase|nr:glycoside hydrolase family 15 protein [Mycobacteriales bacterium]